MAQTPSKGCEFCNKPATLYCYEDKQFLCSQCRKDIHDRVTVCRDHNVVDIHKAGNRIYKPVPVCDSHKKEFLYYCSKCDCLVCKECMTSSHNGHITKEIKSITDSHRQEVDEIIYKLKTKVEELTKTLETIDGVHSLLIKSGYDSYVDVLEKTSAEILQIIYRYKQIEIETAIDFRDTETHKLKGTRVFFQRLHKESSDIMLKFENLLQEPHDNTFFLEWKGLQNEYKTMTEESEQPLSSPRQMSGLNQDTFRRAIIDGIDKQFQMGLKELETAVAVLKEEVETLIEKLKGKQEEINNLSELTQELQLNEKKETKLLDEINKLKTEIKEQDQRRFALQKEKETTVARLTDKIDVLKEKLKMKQEQMDKLSKLSRELQLKEKQEIELLDDNKKLKTEINERNIVEVALSESSEAVLVLIGFPRSGKSETGTTLLGTPDLKTKQEIHHVFCDFPVTVRDTQGFENMSEFGKIYNSLKCYEKKKVVFGLTIRVGRFEPGLTGTLKDIFQEKGIGKHLQRKTFLVFTNVDELENDEDCYQDGFIEWLRNYKGLVLLIALLDLDYCVVQNRQSGDKRVKQAYKLVQEMKRKLQKDNQEEIWYHFVNNKSVEDMLCSTCFKDDESYKDIEFVKRLHQNVKMTYCHFASMVDRLHRMKDEADQIDMIFEALTKNESYMTNSDVVKVKRIIRRKNANCNIL